jgi:hypothetical protein
MASKDGSTFFFTSESVNEGHPDKLADQVRGARRSIGGDTFVRSLAHSWQAGRAGGARLLVRPSLAFSFSLSAGLG